MKILLQTKQGVILRPLPFNAFGFNGGERHIRIELNENAVDSVKIVARLNNSDAIMDLLLCVDALRRQYGNELPVHLFIPYFPYARQDRVCVPGEAFSAKVMAQLINQLSCDKVTVMDAHSQVILAALKHCENINQADILEHDPILAEKIHKGQYTLVAPDKGAREKARYVAKRFGQSRIIEADKVRNPVNGHIESMTVHGNVAGKDLLIIDDICDGGRTFIELAKQLKAQGANHIALYVTHGLFSKGLSVFSGLIDTLYTTDSIVHDGLESHETVTLKVINFCDQH